MIWVLLCVFKWGSILFIPDIPKKKNVFLFGNCQLFRVQASTHLCGPTLSIGKDARSSTDTPVCAVEGGLPEVVNSVGPVSEPAPPGEGQRWQTRRRTTHMHNSCKNGNYGLHPICPPLKLFVKKRHKTYSPCNCNATFCRPQKQTHSDVYRK